MRIKKKGENYNYRLQKGLKSKTFKNTKINTCDWLKDCEA